MPKKSSHPAVAWGKFGVALALSIYGIFAFFRRSFPQKLSGEASFDAFSFEDSFPQFFADYFCIAALFFCVAFVVKKKFPR